jgi:hypothetical protein
VGARALLAIVDVEIEPDVRLAWRFLAEQLGEWWPDMLEYVVLVDVERLGRERQKPIGIRVQTAIAASAKLTSTSLLRSDAFTMVISVSWFLLTV